MVFRAGRFQGRGIVLLLALAVGMLAGCGRGEGSVRAASLVPLTTDAITTVLMGLPPDQQATNPTSDAPILKKGTYETALIAADAPAFAQLSRGMLSEKDIRTLQKKVAEEVNRNVRHGGFTARETTYPPSSTEPKTVLCALTPQTEETGSPTDRATGKAKSLVYVKLTVTDAATGSLLTQRQYYSGTDAAPAKKP